MRRPSLSDFVRTSACGCSTVGCSKPKSANSDEPFMGMTGSMGIRDSLDVKWP